MFLRSFLTSLVLGSISLFPGKVKAQIPLEAYKNISQYFKVSLVNPTLGRIDLLHKSGQRKDLMREE
jgi:hypothetical protein